MEDGRSLWLRLLDVDILRHEEGDGELVAHDGLIGVVPCQGAVHHDDVILQDVGLAAVLLGVGHQNGVTPEVGALGDVHPKGVAVPLWHHLDDLPLELGVFPKVGVGVPGDLLIGVGLAGIHVLLFDLFRAQGELLCVHGRVLLNCLLFIINNLLSIISATLPINLNLQSYIYAGYTAGGQSYLGFAIILIICLACVLITIPINLKRLKNIL